MSKRGSKWQSYLVELFSRYRSFHTYNTQRQLPSFMVAKLSHGYSMHQGLNWISGNSGTGTRPKHGSNMVKADMNNVRDLPARAPTPTPTPPRFNVALWAKWLLGSMLSLLLPFWKQKWEQLQKIEGEAEMVVEEVENVAEMVEKAATMAEKVSAEVADMLPDQTKLKQAASFVERVSKETAHDAEVTLNFIHKVDELKQDLHELEKLVEPTVNNIVQHESKVTHKP